MLFLHMSLASPSLAPQQFAINLMITYNIQNMKYDNIPVKFSGYDSSNLVYSKLILVGTQPCNSIFKS